MQPISCLLSPAHPLRLAQARHIRASATTGGRGVTGGPIKMECFRDAGQSRVGLESFLIKACGGMVEFLELAVAEGEKRSSLQRGL